MPITLDDQRAAIANLNRAALLWWEARRPVDWDLRKHLDNPVVNTRIAAEKQLAQSVVAAVICGSI